MSSKSIRSHDHLDNKTNLSLYTILGKWILVFNIMQRETPISAYRALYQHPTKWEDNLRVRAEMYCFISGLRLHSLTERIAVFATSVCNSGTCEAYYEVNSQLGVPRIKLAYILNITENHN